MTVELAHAEFRGTVYHGRAKNWHHIGHGGINEDPAAVGVRAGFTEISLNKY